MKKITNNDLKYIKFTSLKDLSLRLNWCSGNNYFDRFGQSIDWRQFHQYTVEKHRYRSCVTNILMQTAFSSWNSGDAFMILKEHTWEFLRKLTPEFLFWIQSVFVWEGQWCSCCQLDRISIGIYARFVKARKYVTSILQIKTIFSNIKIEVSKTAQLRYSFLEKKLSIFCCGVVETWYWFKLHA